MNTLNEKKKKCSSLFRFDEYVHLGSNKGRGLNNNIRLNEVMYEVNEEINECNSHLILFFH